MGDKQIYIIQDCGSGDFIKVALTEEQLSAITHFMKWADIRDEYEIEKDITEIKEW